MLNYMATFKTSNGSYEVGEKLEHGVIPHPPVHLGSLHCPISPYVALLSLQRLKFPAKEKASIYHNANLDEFRLKVHKRLSVDHLFCLVVPI